MNDHPISEEAFLTKEAQQTRAAIRGTLLEIKEQIGQSADVRNWITEYPWISAASAATLGFLVAARVTPAADQSFGEKLSELREALDEKRRAGRRMARKMTARAARNGARRNTDAGEGKKSFLSSVISPLANGAFKAILKSQAGAFTP